jgi:hypothetical protein
MALGGYTLMIRGRNMRDYVTPAAVLVFAVAACGSPSPPYLGPEPPPITAAESRAVGCYDLLTPWRLQTEQFALLARHGLGAGPERTGRLIRPRGGYASAHWGAVAGDTLELVWTNAQSDSTRFEPGVIYWDALRARVTLRGDTLSGRATWRTDVGRPVGDPPWDVRAIRVNCPADTPR